MANITRFVQKRVMALVLPLSTDEDSRRREYILNIILLTSITLLAIFDITIVYNQACMATNYDGIWLLPFSLILLLFIGLFTLSKIGHWKLASYALIGIYVIGTVYCGYRWGASLPMTLLSTGLVIFITSILMGTRYGTILSVLMVLTLFAFGVREYNVLGVQPWKYLTISTTDVIVYSVIFLFITILSWLSNREIEHSLQRARTSENILKQERDNLEITVSQRTEELRKIQLEQMMYLSKSAEFGKLSQGLFHDLMTPLGSIVLGVERINTIDHPELAQISESVRKTVVASKKMGEFMETVRRSIHTTQDNELAKENSKPHKSHQSHTEQNLGESIRHVLTVLGFKIRNAGVEITYDTDQINQYIIGNRSMDIERVLTNILSNAIDSEPKIISIETKQESGYLLVSVIDDGCGISEENQKKIFATSFSTKNPHQSNGIGLTIVKNLVEDKLGGTISISSKLNHGTVVTFRIPL